MKIWLRTKTHLDNTKDDKRSGRTNLKKLKCRQGMIKWYQIIVQGCWKGMLETPRVLGRAWIFFIMNNKGTKKLNIKDIGYNVGEQQ